MNTRIRLFGNHVTVAIILAFLASASAKAADQDKNNIPGEAATILDQASQFELFSIHPDPLLDEKYKDHFHGWKVLGQTGVNDLKIRKKLVAAFKKGVKENEGMVARCFNPRHAIRASHDGKTADFVICFECYQVWWYLDGKERDRFLITNSPQQLFDKVLTDANVPLAGKPEKK